MVEIMQQHNSLKKKNSGKLKLTLYDQVLVLCNIGVSTVPYRTYFPIAQDWGVAESTICRTTVHKVETVESRLWWPSLTRKKVALLRFDS